MVRVKVMVRVRVKVKVKVKVMVRVRVKVKVKVMVRVMVMVRVKVKVMVYLNNNGLRVNPYRREVVSYLTVVGPTKALLPLNPEVVMPDITLCSNKECPMAETCFRATAKPNPYWQNYTRFENTDDDECQYYWPNSELIHHGGD
jgi:hypothetical protein